MKLDIVKERYYAITIIFFAATILIAGLISLFLRYNSDPNIWKAIQKHDKKEVMRLLSQDPDIFKKMDFGDYTPLHEAVKSGDIEIVCLLIEKGADVNAVAEATITPLHLAAFYGRTEILKKLLESGANINARGYRHHDTPLHVAVIQGYSDITKILLDAGSDITARNDLGHTPTDLAFEYNQPKILEIFRHYKPSNRKVATDGNSNKSLQP